VKYCQFFPATIAVPVVIRVVLTNATAIVMEHVPPNKCSPGGQEVKEKIQKILDSKE